MKGKFALVAALLAFCLTEASAAIYSMECRLWVDSEYRGSSIFTFDSQRELLLTFHKPEGLYPLFGQKVGTWKLLWQKGNIAVLHGLDSEDWSGPVKILSLNFGDVKMFPYNVGSIAEESTLLSNIERRCRRLD